MISESRLIKTGAASALLATLVCAGVAVLTWFGYRAAQEWQRSSALLVDRRSREIADLLATALSRDMRAVQVSVLASQEWNAASFEPPYEINDLIASAFARYPYPECFFGGRASSEWKAVFFARSDRRPRWLPSDRPADRYPVELASSPLVERILADRIRRDVVAGKRYSIFETRLGGNSYQVVIRLLYRDGARKNLDSVFGFMVNLDWARTEYVSGITRQVSRIAEASIGLEYTLFDEKQRDVLGRTAMPASPQEVRKIPFAFFDPALIALDPPLDLTLPIWTIHVSGAGDPTLTIAANGARRTLLVVSAAALVLGLGLLILVRAARTSADLAVMRSDFVSTVTHELKTPLSTIRAIGQTLIRGRMNTAEGIHSYAQLLVQEERRLTRLVDNLLAYSRITDVTQAYTFEALEPNALITEALGAFERQLLENEFEVNLNVPSTLPSIQADRTSMVLALDNLIDNAIRYSGHSRWISVMAENVNGCVAFHIADRGVGIPAEEIPRVQRRFVRGHSANGQGSGLGLAIVRRVTADHQGTFSIESHVGMGTEVTVTIPLAEATRS